ncbi:hypothetical protein [Arthrobacter sp.]|uniref:hypothetical protein n=1 Tax=Arthrobacter sp. TaxID=1667 RepID=UPI00339A7C53
MDLAAGAGDGVLLELRAREAFAKREYVGSADLAKRCAEQAAESNDPGTWWHMTFLEAESYRESGDQKNCIKTARSLKNHSLSVGSAELMCRVLTLEAVSLQGAGELREALTTAESAVKVGQAAGLRNEIQIGAESALVAALAESGRIDQAWVHCQDLIQLLKVAADAQLAGKAYWVVGNVAFLRQQSDVGVHYHGLAAEQLSPSNDLGLWAWFNMSSAAMRLSAGIADQETTDCMDRAELAGSIIGTSEQVRHLNELNRARWFFLKGKSHEAANLLGPICSKSDLPHQTAGEANMLLAKALRELGDCQASLRHFKDSQAHFSQAGAKDRAAQVAAEIAGFPQAS